MSRRDEATERQVLAADPRTSTWVSANAGSGKTRVLTDRVTRLLLAGVPPERILCLTYTKAAASEMQNRLFLRLGAWAMLPDDTLRAALTDLGEAAPESSDALRDARRLFARAIDAPGGLRIQTIHAFCAALLRRFPLEAGVSPQFSELDERMARLLMEDIVDALAEEPGSTLVEALARQYTGDDFAGLAGEILRMRGRFRPEQSLSDWLARFGLPPGFDEAALLGEVFLGGERGFVDALLPRLDPANRAEKGAHAALSSIGTLAPPGLGDLALFEEACLTGAKARDPFAAKTAERGGNAFPKKAVREALGARLAGWDDFQRRVEAARPRRVALLAARRNHALHAFAGPFLAQYDARKQALGQLDFDDLILRAGALLQRPGVAEWVLFRLDGGIDHILVDEAQDTAPAQWEVIRLIAEEFSAGASARSDVPRTLFVVGDLKQSIYSFQGADPANFERMAGHFGQRLAETGSRLERTELQHSFRSAPAILRVVDAAFHLPERHVGLGGAPRHVAFFGDRPGRVDLWPVEPAAEAEPDPNWYDPVDRIDPTHHDLSLARRIAAEIRRLCDPQTGETLPLPPATKGGPPRRRVLQPGDFLILVQRRSTLFAELIRACKAAGLPIAGSDRLRLGAELAVRDLAALMAFLATPEDDLSLAAALRSPLFGWSEDALYRLAAGRGERYLWEVLRTQDSACSETLSVLNDLRREADFLRPYELLERILTRHDGRRRLLARLGPEAEDGIDALIAQTMAYERMEVPSLTGFLSYLETEDVEAKRQLESGGGVIRVMTVHGAKGLESPVIILPDTRAPSGQGRGEIVASSGDGVALWRSRAEDAPPELRDALDLRADRLAEERMRLLYVAMTRAESWLIVAGAGEAGKAEAGSWHAILGEAMARVGAVAQTFPTGTGLRHAEGPGWESGEMVPAEVRPAPAVALPPWVRSRPPEPPPTIEPRAPSDLGGAKALPGEPGLADEAAALRRGRQMHLLFEHLPALRPEDRAARARALLAAGEDAAAPAEADSLCAEAAAILDDPAFADIFRADALTEVEIAADLPGVGAVLGAIDRLILAGDRVLAIDYKTNALVPPRPDAVPEGILRQMGAYAAALNSVYPGRKLEIAVLWTAAPLLMPLPPALLAEALARAAAP